MEGLFNKQPFVKRVKVMPETSFDDNRFELAGTASYLCIDNLSEYTVDIQLGDCSESYPLGPGTQIELPVHAIHLNKLSFKCDDEADLVVLAGCYSSQPPMDW